MLQWKSRWYYIFWVCLCSLSYPARYAHAPYCNLWLVNIFPNYLTKGTIFGGGSAVHKMRFVIFSANFAWNISFYEELRERERERERDVKKMCICLHVKYPLSLLDSTEIVFKTYFRKIHKYQISWKSVQWGLSCSMRTDRHVEVSCRSQQLYERA